MQITAIGDIGVLDTMLHTGDEAMFEELVTRMSERGVDRIVAISANPADSVERYGRFGVEAVERIGGWRIVGADASAAERASALAANEARQEAVVALAVAPAGATAPLAATDTAHAVVDAIRSSDGVVVAGGGNMASTWPVHIWERSTIGAVAAALDVPLVVTGQTIGPALTADDGERVRRLLSGAAFVGVREPSSHLLSVDLGVPAERLVETIDDASFLGYEAFDAVVSGDAPGGDAAGESAGDATGGATGPATARIALVSLSGHLGGADRDAVVARLAELLDGLSEQHGFDIRFLPHFAPVDQYLPSGEPDVRGDVRLHEAVRSAMTRPSAALPVGDSLTAAHLARTADLVVTSRYHPAVFAASAGTPVLAIAVDDYTTVKLIGATGRLGQDAVITIDEVVDGAAPARAASVVASATGIRSAGRVLAAERRGDAEAWWNRIVRTFGG